MSWSLDNVKIAGIIRLITMKSEELGISTENNFTTVTLTTSLGCTTPTIKMKS